MVERVPYNVNFCLFAECVYLHKDDEWVCLRESCVVSKTLVDWWASSLYPKPLIVSNPPSGCHQVYNLYANKVEGKYRLVMVVETEPRP